MTPLNSIIGPKFLEPFAKFLSKQIVKCQEKLPETAAITKITKSENLQDLSSNNADTNQLLDAAGNVCRHCNGQIYCTQSNISRM